MKELKFKEMVKKLIIPMFLLVGLVFASATTASAQTFKSPEDALILAQTQYDNAMDEAAPGINERVNVQEQALISVKIKFYGYLITTLNGGQTGEALQATSERMSDYYLNDAQNAPYFSAVKQEAYDLLSD